MSQDFRLGDRMNLSIFLMNGKRHRYMVPSFRLITEIPMLSSLQRY